MPRNFSFATTKATPRFDRPTKITRYSSRAKYANEDVGRDMSVLHHALPVFPRRGCRGQSLEKCQIERLKQRAKRSTAGPSNRSIGRHQVREIPGENEREPDGRECTSHLYNRRWAGTREGGFYFVAGVIKLQGQVRRRNARQFLLYRSPRANIDPVAIFERTDRRAVAGPYFTPRPARPMLFPRNALQAKYADNTNPRIRLRIRG